MTKVKIEPGVCGFVAQVEAVGDEDTGEVTLTVRSGCAAVCKMMETVGTSLVMGNARPALKELADHIVPSVEEDGVAVGINRYVLA